MTVSPELPKPWYHGKLDWLVPNTIYLTRHGSHAYGTNIETSDLDVKGIAIAPLKYYFGFTKTFEQVVESNPDLTVFDIRKFFRLAADNNPNIAEVLWSDESDHLLQTKWGRAIVDAKQLFLSRKARFTFSGYAQDQLRRIETHRKWLLNPRTAPPTREEFGLKPKVEFPDNQREAALAAVQKKLDTWNVLTDGMTEDQKIHLNERLHQLFMASEFTRDEKWMAAARTIGYEENFLQMLNKERLYTNAVADWESYLRWRKERNPERAALEAKFLFDTKHGMHLMRLLIMGGEALEEGKIFVKRTKDRERLLSVRRGEVTFEALVSWAKEQEAKLTELVLKSPLPWSADFEKLDPLCVDLITDFHRTQDGK